MHHQFGRLEGGRGIHPALMLPGRPDRGDAVWRKTDLQSQNYSLSIFSKRERERERKNVDLTFAAARLATHSEEEEEDAGVNDPST